MPKEAQQSVCAITKSGKTWQIIIGIFAERWETLRSGQEETVHFELDQKHLRLIIAYAKVDSFSYEVGKIGRTTSIVGQSLNVNVFVSDKFWGSTKDGDAEFYRCKYGAENVNLTLFGAQTEACARKTLNQAVQQSGDIFFGKSGNISLVPTPWSTPRVIN